MELRRRYVAGLDPAPTATRQVRMSDLVNRSSRDGLFLLRPELLRERVPIEDPLLYDATRDGCPPCTVESAGAVLLWRLDLVRYPGDPLPTGELARSIGHWNPGDQWEIFEVLSGTIAMVVQLAPDEEPYVVRASAGQLIVLPPDAWHLTYVERGPADVANIYCRALGEPAPDHDKYGGAAPPRMGLRRSTDGSIVTFGEGSPATLAGPRRPRQLPALTELLGSADAASWLSDPEQRWSGLLVRP